MEALSNWAGRHKRLAIGCIILLELVNGFNGYLLGANALPGKAGPYLPGLLLTGLAFAVWIRYQAAAPEPRPTYGQSRRLMLGAFLGNFLLFTLLGGMQAENLQHPAPGHTAYGNRRVVVRADTLMTADRSANVTNVNRKSVEQPVNRQTGKRIGYALLFVLGIILTYFSTGLACGIACSGYGFLALIVFLLGLGFSAGGIFFLGRATDEPLKPMRELTIPERKRAVRRFWLSWLLLIGVTGVLLLISAVR